jgi:hypothetical protein
MANEAILIAIMERLQELGRRVNGSEWRGKVSHVDPGKKMARIVIGKDPDGAEQYSPWLPYSQVAGGLKVHAPPTVGQTMTLRATSGDIYQGTLEAFHWNNDNQSPSDSGDENVLTFGDVRIALTSGGITLSAGGATFSFSGDGFTQTGGQQVHDGKNVGKDHVHKAVMPGPALTGEPN